ncbi:hypothetical protein [Ramlibacter sp. AN1133]|uniref:hypothetical protein n=1 Tax=Ramlibacter sp. AN1133 TaxID=3133429 RepID=UPI0030C56002
MQARRHRVLAGALAVAVGAGVMLAVFFAPRGLRAPAWVVYAAGGAFVLAGATLVAQGTGQRLLARWLPSLVIACLVAPAAWVAFGTGPRRCMVSAWGFGSRLLGRHSDLLCRLAFGAGALVGLLLLLLAVREALRADPEP